MKITRRTFIRIQKKLGRKQNVLKIASETGTRLEIISAIADGWTPVFPKPGRPRQNTPENAAPQVSAFPAGEMYHQHADQSPQRCPECGRLVYLPCLECKLHRRMKLGPRLHLHAPNDSALALDLKPEWQQRYEKIHREKIARRQRELEQEDLLEKTSPRPELALSAITAPLPF